MFTRIFLKKVLIPILLVLAFGLAACQGESSHVLETVVVKDTQIPVTSTDLPPTATVFPSPTATVPVPTATALPSATPTATPRGALNWQQEQRLYDASLKFLAENEEDATIIVRDQIDYLQGIGEHPSLVCGPLSAVILREAGLLPADVDLHGFWLLDPRLRPSQIILETYFPPDRYEWYHFDTPTIEFDFKAFPLLPGDFIYLYAGKNGTFEHIITVSRVDDAGRAYTVSNLATEDGFVIRELMLYDPNRPGEGQFYDWMNREINGWLGMTGDGGFDLWRPKAPVQDYAVR
jgi:hypothetical protein